MWELAAQRKPWDTLTTSFVLTELLRRITAGERPSVDPAWPQAFRTILHRCWDTNPALRPTFPDIIDYFNAQGPEVVPGAQRRTAPSSVC